MKLSPRRQSACACILSAGLLACCGCDRPPPAVAATNTASAPAAAVLGPPREVVEKLLAARAAQKYRDFSALVVRERVDATVKFLMAVDHFLTANRHLCHWIRDHAGVGLSQTIDQSYIAEDLAVYAGEELGIFSRDVQLLDEAVYEDAATVSFTANHALPVRRARLVRVAGAWRYDPGPGCVPALAAAFDDLARGLELARADFEHGRITAEELRGDPQVLVERIRIYLRHGVSLLSKASVERERAAAAPASRPAL